MKPKNHVLQKMAYECWWTRVVDLKWLFFLDLSMVDRRLRDDLRKICLLLKAPRFDLHPHATSKFSESDPVAASAFIQFSTHVVPKDGPPKYTSKQLERPRLNNRLRACSGAGTLFK
jgi:hypothetical protein